MKFLPSRSFGSTRGVALVIVLALLVLVTALIFAFFTSVTADYSSSKSYTSGESAKQLADSAVNVVMAQIRDASAGFAKDASGNPITSQPLAWASQPGMLRTWDNAGSPYMAYKLYSASSLVESGTPNLSAEIPATWASDTANFTDLNAPVVNATGTIYPIVDPTAAGTVEGFSITSAPTTGTTNPAPMPVRWLYLLKDGTLAPSSGTGTTATVGNATSANPIVGRIAFWTDDETCKVNINTASEGTYWDVPRWSSNEEVLYGDKQPAQNEFQRYPGHPAMTSLAPVFFATSSTGTPALSKGQRDAIYSVTPRILGGGSDGGTVIATTPLGIKSDRLYASVDEMTFRANTRSAQDINAAITPDKVRQRAFFLTASSRAPETTVFNTPRVSMWPIYQLSSNGTFDTQRTTPFDRLIAFCSTIAGKPYFFQRADSKSPTNDWANILRNRQLLTYLKTLSGKTIPGFGASLVSKSTPADRDELLVEMLDYIRSTNLFDDNLSAATYSSQADADNAPQFTSGRQTPTGSPPVSKYGWNGHGVVAPLRVPSGFGPTYPAEPDTTSLMGFGRCHTISEACLLFICNADGRNGTIQNPVDETTGLPLDVTKKAPTVDQLLRLTSNVATSGNFSYTLAAPAAIDPKNPFFLPVVQSANGTQYPVNNALAPNTPLSTTEKRVQMMLFFDYFAPMHGWTQYDMDGSMDVEITGDFSLNGQPLGMGGTSTVNFDMTNVGGLYFDGANIGYRKAFLTASGGRVTPARGPVPADTNSSDALRQYGLISQPVTISADATMNFQGPTRILVKLYSRQSGTGRTPNRSANDLVQTIELNFPAASFPTPDLMKKGTGVTGTIYTMPQNWWVFRYGGGFTPAVKAGTTSLDLGRLALLPYAGNPGGAFYTPAAEDDDTLRSLVPYHSDTRLIAASHYVPAGVFQPSRFYFNGALRDTVTYPQIACYITSGLSNNDAGNAYYFPTSGADSNPLVSGAKYKQWTNPKFAITAPSAGSTLKASVFQNFGDFDNGVAGAHDGAYVNKPDEGNTNRAGGTPYFGNAYLQAAGGPTFFSPNRQVPSPGMFGSLPTAARSANVAYSPALPTNYAWRTLLLRPQNYTNAFFTSKHPGATSPPDHLWTDFFWMPIVQPYAISEPFSTAGKINMNYTIAPFSYIGRKTGMAALLRSELLPALPPSQAGSYKIIGTPMSGVFRLPIDTNETLKQWDAKFAGNDLFITPSQICDQHLIPAGTTISLSGNTTNADTIMSTFWATNALTGDNSRERPYTNLLGRLTTKSNSYDVHYKVQVLKKVNSTAANQWVEGKDVVLGEYRGSTLIERFIDPNDSRLTGVDFATDTTASIDNYYKFRVISKKAFTP